MNFLNLPCENKENPALPSLGESKVVGCTDMQEESIQRSYLTSINNVFLGPRPEVAY